uniref:Uncharacterized protein n=1 Tax=Pseudo-nitzschia australis TaxID=44445 RepID=A0A7S4ELC2_9STRA
MLLLLLLLLLLLFAAETIANNSKFPVLVEHFSDLSDRRENVVVFRVLIIVAAALVLFRVAVGTNGATATHTVRACVRACSVCALVYFNIYAREKGRHERPNSSSYSYCSGCLFLRYGTHRTVQEGR